MFNLNFLGLTYQDRTQSYDAQLGLREERAAHHCP